MWRGYLQCLCKRNAILRVGFLEECRPGVDEEHWEVGFGEGERHGGFVDGLRPHGRISVASHWNRSKTGETYLFGDNVGGKSVGIIG